MSAAYDPVWHAGLFLKLSKYVYAVSLKQSFFLATDVSGSTWATNAAPRDFQRIVRFPQGSVL